MVDQNKSRRAPQKLRYQRLGQWLAAVWLILITVLSLLPASTVTSWVWSDIFSLDKVAHFTMYGIAMFLVMWASFYFRKNAPITTLMVILFSILLEVLQNQMYLGRHFEWLDIIANSVGALSGTWFCLWLIQKFETYVLSSDAQNT